MKGMKSIEIIKVQTMTQSKRAFPFIFVDTFYKRKKNTKIKGIKISQNQFFKFFWETNYLWMTDW